jgi:hypothetical protein
MLPAGVAAAGVDMPDIGCWDCTGWLSGVFMAFSKIISAWLRCADTV